MEFGMNWQGIRQVEVGMAIQSTKLATGMQMAGHLVRGSGSMGI